MSLSEVLISIYFYVLLENLWDRGMGIMFFTSLSAFLIHGVIYLCVAHTRHGLQILSVSVVSMRHKSEASHVNA